MGLADQQQFRGEFSTIIPWLNDVPVHNFEGMTFDDVSKRSVHLSQLQDGGGITYEPAYLRIGNHK